MADTCALLAAESSSFLQFLQFFLISGTRCRLLCILADISMCVSASPTGCKGPAGRSWNISSVPWNTQQGWALTSELVNTYEGLNFLLLSAWRFVPVWKSSTFLNLKVTLLSCWRPFGLALGEPAISLKHWTRLGVLLNKSSPSSPGQCLWTQHIHLWRHTLELCINPFRSQNGDPGQCGSRVNTV